MRRRFAKIADGIVSIADAMSAGKSFEAAFCEFCENSKIPLYFKAQVGYGALECLGIDMNEQLRSIPFSQLLKWKNRSETIWDMVPVPSDKTIIKVLSRPSLTESRMRRTDGLSLLERIYAVHEQITG